MRNNNWAKFYFPTGMVSLIVVLILCVWCFEVKPSSPKYYNAIEITWWSPSMTLDYPAIPKNGRPNKHYSHINLIGNDKDDSIKLDSAQFLIRALVKSQDTTIGVHIHFNEQSNYWTLIKAIDICEIEKARFYCCYKNDIWIMNPVRKTEKIDTIKPLYL